MSGYTPEIDGPEQPDNPWDCDLSTITMPDCCGNCEHGAGDCYGITTCRCSKNYGGLTIDRVACYNVQMVEYNNWCKHWERKDCD